jgi:putative membrane protein
MWLMMLMGVGMLIFWGALIAIAVLLIRRLFRTNPPPPARSASADPTPMQILEQRYARGEINREQYLLMVKDLETL